VAGKTIRLPDIFLEFRDGSTDGLREIAILEPTVCHKLREASAEAGDDGESEALTAELADDPENKADDHADGETGDQRKIEGAVLTAVDDVSRQAAETKRQFAAEIQ
jgi:hypothetical protein